MQGYIRPGNSQPVWLFPFIVCVVLFLSVLPLARLAVVGIAGDLFESMLKRSADVKDASGLIPGHGGMLDRIDSLLFTMPLYYVALQWLWPSGPAA